MGNASSLHKKSTALEVVTHFAAAKNIPPSQLLAGSFAVVTGGNSGIGLETVKALAFAGCRVLLASRSVAAGEAALAAEVVPAGLGNYAVPAAAQLVTVAQLDLESGPSIRAFASAALAAAGPTGIQLLVCNAGIMALPNLERTAAGWEKQIGTNHFGHFLLVQCLRDVRRGIDCLIFDPFLTPYSPPIHSRQWQLHPPHRASWCCPQRRTAWAP